MVELFGISVVFMIIALVIRRPWTVALPFVVWLGIAGLCAAGMLPGAEPVESALLAGVIGALFAIAGLVMGARTVRGRPGA